MVNKLSLLKRNLFLIIDASLDLETVHFYGGRGGNRGILRVASVVYDGPLFIRIFWVSPLSHKMTFLIRCHDTLTLVFKAIYIDKMPRCLILMGRLYQVGTTTHDLRGSNNLIVNCVKRTTHGLLTFRYPYTTMWNGLPEDLKSTTFLREFKCKVRQISF